MLKVEQLPLWEVLKADKVEDLQRSKVKKLIEDAAAILDLVIETFPTYTLHNAKHAENVLQLMAELLGARRQDLSPLEAALLMLSAFYHDIGMVFREIERNQLSNEPYWQAFLEAQPEAYLRVKKAGEVTREIAEWYCRWRHADRVYVYLNRKSDELLSWGQTSIREDLGELCRSHNLPASELIKLRTDLRGEADVRFCSILLRLADILDFDRSRSPESVYEHLGISSRVEPRQQESDVEWRKHLSSEGFRFPSDRSKDYQIGFIAGPNEPGVERDVRKFLDVIEDEFQQCQGALAFCSDRWRNLSLPVSIDREDIKSKGYRWGKYLFTLDQREIMDLLMGENLYEEPYSFVRELIQNALDASRHRRFIERAHGQAEFEPEPIQVRRWIDRDGYQWVRFDDYGMGMDEEIVRNHLLKVGSSYYRTASFQAEILRVRERTDKSFGPISRFGIGLLSCFIVGDRVEINTLRRTFQGKTAEPIRLSLNGLHGYFTLQTPQLPPLPMPAPDTDDGGYRATPGTSIGIRLDPSKEKNVFHLEALLKRYVNCPSVSVIFEEERMGGDPKLLLETHWCAQTTLDISGIKETTSAPTPPSQLRDFFQVEIIPLDLTRYSPSPEFKGQVIVANLKPVPALVPLMSQSDRITYLEYTNSTLKLRLSPFSFKDDVPLPEGFLSLFTDSTKLTAFIQLPTSISEILDFIQNKEFSWLSHNGVSIPTGSEGLRISRGLGIWSKGVVALADSLRPDLAVSREYLRSLPWRVYSIGTLALYRALEEAGMNLRSKQWELFNGLMSPPVILEDLLEDELLRSGGAWPRQPIIETDHGLMSLQEIKQSPKTDPIYIFGTPFQDVRRQGYEFLEWCSATLVQVGLKVSVPLDDHEDAVLLVLNGEPDPLTEGHKLFPPLKFVSFDDKNRFRKGRMINSNHPFSVWLLDKAPEIFKRYPGLFERIRSSVLEDWSWGREDKLGELNAALDRLRELHVSVRPPKKVALTKEEFLS